MQCCSEIRAVFCTGARNSGRQGVPVDVAELRRILGLETHLESLAENSIDAETLLLLSDEHDKVLGVRALGHRRKLLSAIAELAARAVDEAEAPASAQTIAPSQVQVGERRQVTVLFADITGFTKFSSQSDPEEVHALLNRFFGIVDDIVQSFGGAVDKHIGDCVMAVFGAAVAHSNDPERAVRAALEIHQAVVPSGASGAGGRPDEPGSNRDIGAAWPGVQGSTRRPAGFTLMGGCGQIETFGLPPTHIDSPVIRR